MAQTIKAGCGAPRPKEESAPAVQAQQEAPVREVKKSMVQVGKPVPNFELQGYHKGEFKKFSLEEFRGKWVLLCFYPGDFTFV